MTPIAEKILKYVAALAEGVPVAAKELLHLGSRAAVDQALSRLVRRGRLLRSGRGLYVRPVQGRFGARVPAAERVVAEVAKKQGAAIATHGAAAANRLGLTTQVPMQMTWLTSGRSRRLQLGNQTIELRHAPTWQLQHPERLSGEVLRALAWVGRDEAQHALQRLKQRLPEETCEELMAARGALPEWLAKTISIELAA